MPNQAAAEEVVAAQNADKAAIHGLGVGGNKANGKGSSLFRHPRFLQVC